MPPSPTTARQILDSADPWADQIPLVLGLLDIVDAARPDDRAARRQIIDGIYRRCRWSAPLLNLAGRLQAPGDSDVASARAAAEDDTWIDNFATRLNQSPSVGILSMGRTTTAVLSAAEMLGYLPAQGFATNRAVGRALEFLSMPIVGHPPQEAAVLLFPAVAAGGSTVYGSSAHVEIARSAQSNGAAVLPILHPLARLEPPLTDRFETASGFSHLRL